jgi:hypothetical protein
MAGHITDNGALLPSLISLYYKMIKDNPLLRQLKVSALLFLEYSQYSLDELFGCERGCSLSEGIEI